MTANTDSRTVTAALFSARLALEADRVGAEFETSEVLPGLTPRRIYDTAQRILPTLVGPHRADAVPRAVDQAAVELGLSPDSPCPAWCGRVTGREIEPGKTVDVDDLLHISGNFKGDDEQTYEHGVVSLNDTLIEVYLEQAITPEAAETLGVGTREPVVEVHLAGPSAAYLDLATARELGAELVKLADSA